MTRPPVALQSQPTVGQSGAASLAAPAPRDPACNAEGARVAIMLNLSGVVQGEVHSECGDLAGVGA